MNRERRSNTAESSVLFDAPGPRTRRMFTIGNVVAIIALVALLAWVVSALADKGQFTADKWLPFVQSDLWVFYFLPGLWATLKAALLAIVTANVFGILFGLGRLSSVAPIRWFCTTVVEFFRAVPVLVMMLAGYYLLSTSGIVNPTDAPYWGVVIGLTLYNGSVIAELVRSGVSSLPRGQREAALSLGLTESKALRIVELPQALIAMMPSMVSQLVVILKDTALGYMINYPELLRQARQAGTTYSNLLPALMVAAVVFIVINATLTWLAHKLAARLSSATSISTEFEEGTGPEQIAGDLGRLAGTPGGGTDEVDGPFGDVHHERRDVRRPGF